ncbi:MAG: SMC-Scp complex subunit ScpB, partial [Gammaproteobacteria bacterium HGW-Gammaproteobacteria-7]
MFWFGRYSERCEDNARLLRIMLARYVDDDDDPQALQTALELGESLGLLPDADSGELQQRLLEALLGEDWPDSLRGNLQRLQWVAGSVRGKLSQANWQALLELQREAQNLNAEQADFGELLDFLERLLMSLAALSGFALDDMTRDDGWRFLMIGRCIERLQFLCDSLANFLRSSAANDQSALEWLLELGNSSITYRTRYLASAQLIPVLDLLLLDEQNPHAVLFQIRTLLRSLERLGELFEENERPSSAQLKKALEVLEKSCKGRAFELKEVASGYRLQVRQRFSPWVGRLWEERPQRYSRAMLETLALIAYRQPITRGEIEDIRGVAVNSQIVKTLLEREWVRVVGHRDVPGRPAMFATTRQFLDHFNLKNLDELPPLAVLREMEPELRPILDDE